MTKEQAIRQCKYLLFLYKDETKKYRKTADLFDKDLEAIEIVLNLIQEQEAEIEKKDKIINNAIIEVENFRQYFDDNLQVDFIRILEILKDKNVLNW